MTRLGPLAAGGLIALALSAAGCPDRSISTVTPAPVAVSTKDIPLSADIDVLFVIDNSSSTQDKQKVFADNYPKFVTALSGFPTGLPNLHLGVVTTSVDIGNSNLNPGSACHPATGQDGLLQTTNLDLGFTCQGALAPVAGERFLSDIGMPDGSRAINYTGGLDQALACISHVGTAGCGFESPLEAMERALDGRHPENAGFLRDGAFLAVVILTDEDDCSAKNELFQQPTTAVGDRDLRCSQQAYRCDQRLSPSQPGAYTNCTVRTDSSLIDPSTYASFLTGLKGSSNIAVAVIAGEPAQSLGIGPLTIGPVTQDLALLPSCMAKINGNDAIGRPALRLTSFLDNFGERGLFRTVCQADYAGALTDIGNLLIQAISPCIEGALDTRDADPTNPGLQPDCTVSDIADAGDEHLIRPCHMLGPEQPDPDMGSATACWWLKSDPAMCQTESQLALQIERTVAAAPNTKTRVSCALGAP
ncbi:MAG TPA: hypothetical protein VFP84_25065 [Kofleriaceae bacterium]|nr:hypothetical protein [Kofleriaceae bacterium]